MSASLLPIGGGGTSPTVQEFPAPNVIALAGSPSVLWDATSTTIDRLDASGHVLHSYALPKHQSLAATSPGEPFAIGSGGGMWFTAIKGTRSRARAAIGFISARGRISLHLLPKGHGGRLLTRDAHGRLWFQDAVRRHNKSVPAIGMLDPKGGRLKDIPVPGKRVTIAGIAVGPGGHIWLTTCGTNTGSSYVGEVRGSHIKRWALPGTYCGGDIVRGPDGNMWFDARLNELGPVVDKVGRITPAGQATYFSLGSRQEQPEGIVSGPDGALWVTDHTGADLARVTVSGTVTHTSLSGSAEPTQIVRGPGSTMWFIDQQSGGFPQNASARVGKIS